VKDWKISPKGRVNKGKKFRAVTMCKRCYTFFYRNSWRIERPLEVNHNDNSEVPVRFTECPACIEQELAMYDSEIALSQN
jgi:hypothetical protein